MKKHSELLRLVTKQTSTSLRDCCEAVGHVGELEARAWGKEACPLEVRTLWGLKGVRFGPGLGLAWRVRRCLRFKVCRGPDSEMIS